MANEQKISVEQCSIYYRIDTSFIQELDEHGLLSLGRSGSETYITYEQLPDLEKYVELYYELDINIAGIEAISHLLNRVQHLQREVRRLSNALENG